MPKRKITRSNRTRSSALTNLVSASINASKKTSALAANRELQALSLQATSSARSLQFGSPSSAGTTSGPSNGLLSGLLSRGANSAVSGLVGGGVFGLLGKSIVSGLSDLFGSSSNESVPLTRFALPESQNITVDVSQTRASAGRGFSNGSSFSRGYKGPNSDVISAMKQALLTSSELSDIISEI